MQERITIPASIMAAPNSRLIIDNREVGLIKLIKEGVIKEGEGTAIMIAALDIGDIHITRDDKIEYVIERKSAADFAASIEDGRYREQKDRMLGLYASDQIMYLVEGYYEWKKTNAEMDRRVSAAIRHTIIRDRIQIYHVPDMATGASFLMSMCGDWDSYRNAERAEYKVTKGGFNGRRKDNSTPERVYRAMLTCVGGVSDTTAKALAEIYPNLRSLVQGTQSFPDLRINGRKINKTIVENLKAIIG